LVLAGADVTKALKQAEAWDTDKIFVLEHNLLEPIFTSHRIDALAPLLRQHNPLITFCSATLDGQDLAAGLAARLGWELVSGCVWVKAGPDNLPRFIRPVHAGRAQQTISLTPGNACITTLLPGQIGVAQPAASRHAEIIYVSPEIQDTGRVRLTGILPGDLQHIDLREADRVVAGGRGASDPKSWRLVEDLAEALDAPLGGSRLALDAGRIPTERMIGQTGKEIAPHLYIAVGISGLLHHLGGVHAHHLIAINNDRSAPVFRQSTLGILGDLNQILPLLIERLSQAKTNQPGRED
jgi:electron transfer flavoprotein alpha subunit